jgi:MFS family permease
VTGDRTPPAITYLLAITYVMAWNTATPFIPLYLTSQGATPTMVGVVVSLSGLLPLLFAVHVGALVDAHGAAPVGRWGVVVEAIACAILVAVPSIPGVAVAYALLGLGNLALTVATQIVVAESSPPAERARQYGYYTSWVSAGMVLGPIVGGLLVDLWGYRAVFISVLALTGPSFLLAGRVKPRARSIPRAATVWSAHKSARTLLTLPGVGLILFISGMVISGQTLRQSFYPLYLRDVGLSSTLIGLIIGAGSLTSMLVRPFIGRWVSQFGYAPLLAGATGLATLSIGVTPLVSSFTPLVVASAALGASIGVTQPLTMSLMADAVTADLWGLAMGVRQTVQRLATVAGPLAFGVLVTAFGIGSSFVLGALSMGVAMLVILRFGTHLRSETPMVTEGEAPSPPGPRPAVRPRAAEGDDD